jgi:hypothetical protein
VTRPEDAVQAARRAAAEARARGAYRDDLADAQLEPAKPVDVVQLLEWALIEPDPGLVYSTRRWGRPITAVKQGLVRGLRQYLGQMSAHQTRFNHHLVLYASALEERVRALETWIVERDRGDPPA